MDHRDLDRQPRGQQIVQFQPRTKSSQSPQLHNDADTTNGVEFQPAAKALPSLAPHRPFDFAPGRLAGAPVPARTVHEILSPRYSRTVFFRLTATSISSITANPIAPPISNSR